MGETPLWPQHCLQVFAMDGTSEVLKCLFVHFVVMPKEMGFFYPK